MTGATELDNGNARKPVALPTGAENVLVALEPNARQALPHAVGATGSHIRLRGRLRPRFALLTP